MTTFAYLEKLKADSSCELNGRGTVSRGPERNNYARHLARATARLKEFREAFKDAPDVGPISGQIK